jgi:hypothetical protein
LDGQIGNILSNVVEVLGSNIKGSFVNVIEDLELMSEKIFEDDLGKSSWVLEDLGPLFNSDEVWFDTFAVSEIFWKSLHEFSECGNCI